MNALFDHDAMRRRIERELIDGYDEEIEMEMEDRLVADPLDAGGEDSAERVRYFRELFRLQGELVKLQDWVAATRQKVVILFEGRDAAGKAPSPCPRPTTASARSGTSSATPRTCRPRARSCCSTGAGTTAPAWSA